MKKIKYIAFILFIILVSIVLFYKPILRSFAQFLIVENKVDYVETAFVLSGGACTTFKHK